MANESQFQISTPIGCFFIALEIDGEICSLHEGKNSFRSLEGTLSSQKISSPNPPKADHPDETYLIWLSFKALSNVEQTKMLFDFHNRTYLGIGEMDSGENFASVFWHDKDHMAHCGFRSTLDLEGNENDFDRLKMQPPKEQEKELTLLFPEMQEGCKLEFYTSFSWTKMKHTDDYSTGLASDYALPNVVNK